MRPLKQFFCAAFVFCVSVVSVAHVSEAQERTWESANGKFSIEGTFVSQSDGKVTLERSDNGKTIKVDITRLSDADQKYLRELAAEMKADKSKAEQTELQTEAEPEFEIVAEAKWSEFPMYSQNGKEEPRDLELWIEAIGELAVDAIDFGKVKLLKCETTDGPIRIKKDRFSFEDPMKEFVKVKRSDNEFFNEHPEDGVRLTLKFDHPETELEEFTLVEGEFKIKTGGEREVIRIEEAPLQAGKKIGNAALKEIRAKAKIEQEDNSLRLVLSGKLKSIYDVQLLTKDGEKPDELMGNGWSGGGGMMSYDFQFQDGESISDDLVIEIKVAKGLKEVTVPFKLQNVEIPAAR